MDNTAPVMEISQSLFDEEEEQRTILHHHLLRAKMASSVLSSLLRQ
jgi:hypothetical protein